ncbi:chemotaxis protein CheW [Porcipelethomonas sp.]|uniref:chemotaxis protein CheW n=1 Tax=Porcipelethomonas sp. TaxID=2981675 RepID=UPI003EF9EA3C
MTIDSGVRSMANEGYSQPVKSEFNTNGGQILLYYIDDVLYGIEIQYVTEIIGVQPITVVPRVPDFIKGVINIRGKVVPVISIRHKINRPEIPYDDKTCIIVVELNDLTVGLIVDRVREITTVLPTDTCSAPDFKNVNENQYIQSIIDSNGEIKQLLDINKLILE